MQKFIHVTDTHFVPPFKVRLRRMDDISLLEADQMIEHMHDYLDWTHTFLL
jgi:hypothetical protein